MKRHLCYVAFLALGAGCLDEDRELLCREDDDCAESEECELVSGLCKPKTPLIEEVTVGAVGAFDCPILSDGPMMQSGTPGESRGVAPGVALVRFAGLEADRRCASAGKAPEPEMPPEGMPPPEGGASRSIPTGCDLRLHEFMLPGPPGEQERREYYVLQFQLVDTTPSNPLARISIHVRASDMAVGELSVPAVAHARYFERCQDAETTELQLRAVGVSGTLQIQEVTEDRIEGKLTVELVEFAEEATKSFGEGCTLTRDCTDGCIFEELESAECTSGVCVQNLEDKESEFGFCSSNCDEASDCRTADSEDTVFCLQTHPGAPGHCLLLCDPDSTEQECPEHTSCRPGTDFNEFPGHVGPPRCLDTCIMSPSTSPDDLPDDCPAPMNPRPDAGGPPPDGGTMDGGPPPDGGAMDGGPPPDGGAMDGGPPPDGGAMDGGPPPDGGAMDGGTPPSPLGIPCGPGAPCPGNFYCATIRAGAVGDDGFCTRACTPGAPGDLFCGESYGAPGTPICSTLPVRQISSGNMGPACVVSCGTSFGPANDGTIASCPGLLHCEDLVTNTSSPLMPPPDAETDLCAEP